MSDTFTHMSSFPVKLKDLGDGTYALVTSQESGGVTTIGSNVTNSSVSVATSNTTIVSSSSRTYIALTNNEPYDVWIAFGDAAIIDKGMVLRAYGGNVVLSNESIYQGDITAIADTTATTIAYVEGTE